MLLALSLAVACAGVVALGFVRGRTALRGLGRLATLLLAAGLSWGVWLLCSLGASRHWTGDGPGMLVVILGFGLGAACAVAAWLAVLRQATADPARGGRAGPALAAVALGLAGVALGALDHRMVSQPTQDAPIAALRFSPDGARLFTLDVAGTLKTWRVADRRLASERAEPALAGARELLVTPDGRFAVALVAAGAVVLPLSDGPAPSTLSGVAHVALAGDGELAVADADGLRLVALHGPEGRGHPLATGAVVTALAGDGTGGLAAALADGAIVLLDGRQGSTRLRVALPAPARRLVLSPRAARVVAVDAEGRAVVVDAQDGSVRPFPGWIRPAVLAFVSDETILATSAPGDPAIVSLALPGLVSAPFWNHGRAVAALDAAGGRGLVAVALAGDVFVAPAPRDGRAYAATSWRLVHRRF
jgi:hypothetical protein